MSLADLFYAKQTIRRLYAKPRNFKRFKSSIGHRKSQILFEPLEPRLLLAADPLLLQLPTLALAVAAP